MAYIVGAGTILKVDISSTMTTVPQVRNVTPPQMEMGMVETTNLSSTGRERMPTLPDGGTVEFELLFDPANAVHTALDGFYRNKTVKDWSITLSDADLYLIEFTGFITRFGIGQLTVDEVVTIPCTIQVTGLPDAGPTP